MVKQTIELVTELLDHFGVCKLSIFDCKTCQQYDAIMNILAEYSEV